MATSQIKITQLTDIGANIPANTVLPIVNLTGTAITQKTNIGNVANSILANAGSTLQPAFLANLAYSVTNAAQPNITSVGTLTSLTINDVANLNIPGGTNGYVLQTNGDGVLSWTAQGGAGNGNPGGANTQVQFNDNGLFGGNNFFTFDQDTATLAVPNFLATSATIYGNLSSVNLNVTTNLVAANLEANSLSTNNFTATGNIGADYFIGNGSQLTGITATANGAGPNTSIQFNNDGIFDGDANLTWDAANAALNTVNINAVNIIGNVSGNILETTYLWSEYLSGDGSNITNIGNANYANSANTANIAALANSVAVANVTGIGNIATVSLDGNAGNILYGNGSFSGSGNLRANTLSITGVANISNTTQSVNPGSGALKVAGGVGVQGNIHGGNEIHSSGNMFVGGQSLFVGPSADAAGLTEPTLVIFHSGDQYIQAAIKNSLSTGSADWIAYGDNSTDSQGWADMGFTSSEFGDANYTITGPGDGYFFVESFAGSYGGNLVLSTGSLGVVNDIVFSTGGFLANNEFARIEDANNTFRFTKAGSSITFSDNTVQNTAWTGTVAAANVTGLGNISTVNFDGNSSNVLYGNGVFDAVGSPFNQDLNTTDNVTFANITSTDAIRFTNSGNIVGAFGYAPTYVSIEGYQSNSVVITTNDIYSWTFGNDGNLTLPGNTFSVNYANGAQVSLGGSSNIANGNSNVNIATANGNVTIAAVGNNVVTITGTGANITGTANISGNANVGNLGVATVVATANISTTGYFISGNQATGGFQLGNSNSRLKSGDSNSYMTMGQNPSIYPDTTASATAGVLIGGNGYLLGNNGARNITLNYAGTSGQVGLNANLQVGTAGSGTVLVPGTVTTGVNSILAGPTFTPLSNTMAGFVSNVNNYTQLTIQNKNVGADATVDFIATADNGNDTVNYLDMGIINSGYDANTPTNSLGNIVFAADSYMYAQGNTSNASQSGGNLAIGTSVPGKNVKIFAGGVDNTAIVANIANTGVTITGNLNVSGNITGNTAGFAIGYRDIPQIVASNTTLAATDGGKHYYSTTAGNLTLTIPNNATTSFATGTAITIVVQAAGNILVNAAAGVTLYMAGSSSAGNRVVGTYGMATLMKVASDTWFINGTGVS